MITPDNGFIVEYATNFNIFLKNRRKSKMLPGPKNEFYGIQEKFSDVPKRKN